MEKQNLEQTARPVPAQPVQEDTIDLEELALRLLAGWKLIVCLALVGAILAGVYVFFLATPMYSATSIIYVITSKDSAINLSDLQMGTQLANDYVEVFSMWEVHDEVITNLGLNYTYNQMSNHLTVSNPSSTRMLKITFTSDSPVEAANVANEYAKVVSDYIEDTMSTDRPNTMSVARVPSTPDSPKKGRSIILGFALGFLLACGILTVQFLLDDKIKSSADVRKYAGLATLATVPLDTPSSRREKEDKI